LFRIISYDTVAYYHNKSQIARIPIQPSSFMSGLKAGDIILKRLSAAKKHWPARPLPSKPLVIFSDSNPICIFLFRTQFSMKPAYSGVTPVIDTEILAQIFRHTLLRMLLNKGEQMVRYYGDYSNVSRGRRKKAQDDDQIPCILEPRWP